MRNGKRMRHSKWQKLDWAIDIKDQMWKCAEMNLHTGMTLPQRICYSHWANGAQNGVISIWQWGCVFNHEKGAI
jgi:hypothetical protein